jgi:hypothetical protein
MKKEFIIHKNGLYITEINDHPMDALQIKTLRDISKALRFPTATEASLNCPNGFKVEEYKMSYQELQAYTEKLEDALSTFISHSHGLSKYYKFYTLHQRLTASGEHDLLKDIENLYSYQCHIEEVLDG